MVQEAAHPGRMIERQILMKGARRQALGHQRGGRNGAGRQQDMLAARDQRLDQIEQRQRFADACPMTPDERPVRPAVGRKGRSVP